MHENYVTLESRLKCVLSLASQFEQVVKTTGKATLKEKVLLISKDYQKEAFKIEKQLKGVSKNLSKI